MSHSFKNLENGHCIQSANLINAKSITTIFRWKIEWKCHNGPSQNIGCCMYDVCVYVLVSPQRGQKSLKENPPPDNLVPKPFHRRLKADPAIFIPQRSTTIVKYTPPKKEREGNKKIPRSTPLTRSQSGKLCAFSHHTENNKIAQMWKKNPFDTSSFTLLFFSFISLNVKHKP